MPTTSARGGRSAIGRCYLTAARGRGRGEVVYPRAVTSAGIPLALSYDDVLLTPRRSGLASRSDVDVSTRLTRRLRLAAPVVSANMDTVTEAEMAIAMARVGGIGIVHRFLTVERQVAEVVRVKRAEALVIADPHTIADSATLADAREAADRLGVSSLVVTGPDGRLEGLLTRRDVLLRTDSGPAGARADDAARRDSSWAPPTPPSRWPRGCCATGGWRSCRSWTSDDRLVGLITLRDLLQRAERPEATKDARGRLAVGAAIGVRGDYVERARALQEAGADVVVLDIAHGHAEHAVRAIATVRDALGGRDGHHRRQRRDARGRPRPRRGRAPTASRSASDRARSARPASWPASGVPQLSAVMECARGVRPVRRARHRGRRHPLRRRRRQGDRRGGRDRDGRQPAGRHPGEPGRRGLAQRRAREGLPRHGVERRRRRPPRPRGRGRHRVHAGRGRGRRGGRAAARRRRRW